MPVAVHAPDAQAPPTPNTKGDAPLLASEPVGTPEAPALVWTQPAYWVTGFRSFWGSLLAPPQPPKVVATRDDYAKAGLLAPLAAGLDNYFRISDRGSTFKVEFMGGMTTFFSMCYIMALNGIILCPAPGPDNNYCANSITPAGSFFATALASGIFTLLMGVLVNVPLALAPGMGLNGYFAVLIWSGALNYQNALGAVFMSGIFYIFFTFTGMRAALFTAIPAWMRHTIAVGIGFFICMIGLKIGEITSIVTLPPQQPLGPQPFYSYNNGIVSFPANGAARLSVLGIAFVLFFSTLRVPGAVIISIILTTLIGINYPAGNASVGDSSVPFSAVTNLVMQGWYLPGGPNFLPQMSNIPSGKLLFDQINTGTFWEATWTFLAVELFDSFGTVVAVLERANLMKDEKRGMDIVNKAMAVDGFGLCIGAVIGSNSITCYIESLTGIEAGARTGFASFITGACFLLSLLFLAPFVLIIPDAATCCALVFVGVMSLKSVRYIDFEDFTQVAVSFLTIATMGFTYSIFNGLSFGFISFCLIRITLWTAKAIATRWPMTAKYLMPSEGQNCHRPSIVMVVISIFMVLRFRYLGA